jgi:site-specific recombinase XerC
VVIKTKAIPDINAYRTYIDALDNPYTRKNYEIHFSEFRKALKASQSCNELLEMDGREIEDRLVEHIKRMAKAGASTASIRLMLSAVRKFFVENRQENRVNWSWLKSRIPRSNGKVKDRDYTKEELVKMWEQSDIRKKAILSLLMTGIRKGAIPDLRVGSLSKITEYMDKERRQHKFEKHHIYKLTVYEGNESEYITFLTPAGAKAVDRYIEARTMAGEKVTANSPLIRDVFDSVNAGQPKLVTLGALDMAFTRLTRSVGIRPKEKKEEEGRKRQDRHDIMLFHGIRKYVNHALVNAGCNVIAKELLIGHAAPGLEGSYLRPTQGELLAEFVKAIPALSLSQESELRQQVDRLRVEVADIDVLKEGYLELKEDNKRLQEQIAALIEASKRAAENKRILDDTEPPLASA